MKKFCIITVFLILAASVFAQNSLSANKKTAERCLKLAENSLLISDYTSALSNSELGISYDDSISDLFYVKAVAQNHLDYKVHDVLETITQAFILKNWINYNENNARILYADLLSDTGSIEESMQILDQKPYIYSSDAEFIRIKNLYRTGSEDALKQARNKLSSSRKIYPNDVRFPYVFFMFESMLKLYAENNGEIYYVPEIVKNIASAYIAKIPDYTNPDVEMETMALMFADGEEQKRLLSAVGEKSRESQIFALTAMKSGIISDDYAYHLFFEENDGFSLVQLRNFVLSITDPDVWELVRQYMNAFNGTLYIDDNRDLNNELWVKYERGRPSYISYDANNDGIDELYSVCDFGVPLGVNFTSSKIDLFYEDYPAVLKVENLTDKTFYSFQDVDFNFTPYNIISDPVLAQCDIDLFIPYINKDAIYPDENKMLASASMVQLPVTERPDSYVTYTMYKGMPVFVNFAQNNAKYGFCSFEGGLPYTRYVDYDNDNIFETMEYYDLKPENSSADNSDEIIRIFGNLPFFTNLRLSKIEIDRDFDTVVEYKEEYLEENGRISTWDTDGNGLIDFQYIRYPDSYGENGAVVEESVFYESNGVAFVTLTNANGIPVRMKYWNTEYDIHAGSSPIVYWIGEAGTKEQELEMLKASANNFENGVVSLWSDEEKRYSVIKIDGKLYYRLLPPAEIIEDENVNE